MKSPRKELNVIVTETTEDQNQIKDLNSEESAIQGAALSNIKSLNLPSGNSCRVLRIPSCRERSSLVV